MTNEVKNVPELRFSDFSEEWKSEKLGNISDRVKRKNQNLESKMPLTISGNLGLVDQVTYFSKSVSAKNLENYTLIKKGEFAYNKSYSNGYPLGAIKRLEKYDKGVLSTLYICFRFNENQNTEYMKQYFETSKWHKEVSAIAVEGARNHGLLNISVNEFFTVLLSIPSLNEQNKIGEFFNKLDRQIELEEQKLAKLEEQKKGYMQKIFSQELRFKDENGNEYSKWEEVKLQNIANIKKGEQIKKENIDNNGKYYHLNGGTTASNRTNLFNTNPFTISISEGGNSCGFIKMNKEYFFSGGHNYTLLDLSVSNYYLYAYLKYHEKNIMSLRVGSGLPNIQKKDISNYLIKIPSKEEQEKIGIFFLEFDELIDIQRKKIEVLKKQKNGFLQKMFV